MPEEKIASILREFAKAIDAGDVEKTLAFFTEDAVYVSSDGTFNGKDAIRRYISAIIRNMKDLKFAETGNGLITHGDRAFVEYILSGIFQGKKFEVLAIDAYEFSGDKFKAMRTVFDRLRLAQQVAKGWPAKPLINMVVKQSEKAMK